MKKILLVMTLLALAVPATQALARPNDGLVIYPGGYYDGGGYYGGGYYGGGRHGGGHFGAVIMAEVIGVAVMAAEAVRL